MTDSICIVGQGRSYKRIKEISHLFDEVILCNYDTNFIPKILEDKEILDILQEKKCTLFCNASKAGFNDMAFQNFNVERCVVNRVKPTDDWQLWRRHKAQQTKGLMHTRPGIPEVIKDLPYMYRWRGPAPVNPDGTRSPFLNVNHPVMSIKTNTGKIFNINHLSEAVEEYLFEPTNDRLETNMGLYFTALYSIVDLKKKKLYYAGIDFYDTQGEGEGWKYHSYDRIRMEGAHMKILADEYLPRYFPEVEFNFYTYADFNPNSENVKVIRGENQ